jgi:hypothetical protein
MVNAAPREVVIDLRHRSEDASRLLYERTIDDRNALEAKITALQKENYELKSQIARKIYR